ncbi:hypothetical protein ROA7450_03702 [Roseovarius albus]|uniref:Uncharacterized protein n=1 Tax=Roseovarius albus TaxID=1247867 RepID=A0A1X7A2J3_9RHOB|nr:hypothetical protein [Roseovarius albus]SLN68779.1 hypothetical protein ROA7450_03702 [Roseovarius albus]
MTALNEIRVGDCLDVDDGIIGAVVFNSVVGEWSDNFPEQEWPQADYLGIMIQQENGALVFFDGTTLVEEKVPLRRIPEPG